MRIELIYLIVMISAAGFLLGIPGPVVAFGFIITLTTVMLLPGDSSRRRRSFREQESLNKKEE